MKNVAPRVHEQGFTLLEVLTALVIGTLLIVFVQQALVMAGRSTERVHAVTADVLRNSIAHDAVRQVVAGTRPVVKIQNERFAGGVQRMSGLTSSPLLSTGVATYALELRDARGGRELVYREGTREAVLFEVPAGAEFRYFDERRKPFEEWKGTGATGELPLPAWVAIQDRAGNAQLLLALPRVLPSVDEAAPRL